MKRKLSTKKSNKRAFRKFLYDNDALEAWYNNTLKLRGKERLKEQLRNIDNVVISGAFGWSESPEGIDFWSNLHYKWEEMWNKMSEAHQ